MTTETMSESGSSTLVLSPAQMIATRRALRAEIVSINVTIENARENGLTLVAIAALVANRQACIAVLAMIEASA